MCHGLVALENDGRPGIGLWEYAIAKGDFLAVYAPREMESFQGKTGELWRSTFIRDLGMIKIGPLAEIHAQLGLNLEYGRYEPGFSEQFIDMYKTCTAGTMTSTTCDVTDDEAKKLLNEYEQYSNLKIDFAKPHWKTFWKPSLTRISTGKRWWYVPHPIWDFPITILLTPETDIVDAVIRNRSNGNGFEILERW
jgi:hypothetical protein